MQSETVTGPKAVLPLAAQYDPRSGLRRECLSFWEVVAQSVANIAPSATPALVVPLVYGITGNGTWLAYVFSTIALLAVTYQINQFARRSAAPGSLYIFVAQGLGPTWGVLTGWCVVIAYLIIGGSVVAGFANYVGVLVQGLFKLTPSSALTAGAMILDGIGVWYIASRDIRLSTRLMLSLEFVSVSLILILAFTFLLKSSTRIDAAQLALSGVTAKGLRQALVLAIFSYVGFESATALGHEAKQPLRFIPRSVLFTVVAVGLLFVFMSYVLVLAFRGQPTPLAQSNAPLNVLAAVAGIPTFGLAIAAGVAVGFFACALACVNAGSRVLFAMSRHGLFHAAAGGAHEKHATPYVAVTFASLIVLGAPLVMFARKVALLDIFGYLGTLGTFGVLFAYVLVSIASPAYLRRIGELGPMSVVMAVASVLLLGVPIVGSLYPVPAPPYNYLPYVFLALLALGVARFAWLRVFRPAIILDIERDLERESGRMM